MSNKEITRVPEILPDNLAAESVEFVTFLKKYYEWLGQEGNPSHDIDRSLTQRTLDNAVDFYLTSLYNELGYGFVLNNDTNQQNIVNNLAEIYSAKGSLQSVKVMFRALFGEEIDIKLPKEQIFKASSGNWLSEYSVIVELNEGDLYSAVGKYVEVETTFPNTPTQTFDVEVKRVEQREETSEAQVYEVYVSRYFAGFFYFNSVLKYGDVRATLQPSMSEILNIETGGTGFRVGETFPINDYVRSNGFNTQAKLPTNFRRRVYSRSGLRRIDIEDVDTDVRSDGTITQTIKLGDIVTTRIIRGTNSITRIEQGGQVKEFKETLPGIPTPNLAINWDAIATAMTELAGFDGLDGTVSIFLYDFLKETPIATYVDGTTDPLFDTTGGATQYARGDFDRDGTVSIDDATSLIKYLFDIDPTLHAGDTDRYDRITDVITAWNAYTTANGLSEYAFALRSPNTSGDAWDPTYSIPIDVGVDLLRLSVDAGAYSLSAQTAQLNELAGSTQYKKGDIDNDGTVDTDDLVTLIKYQDPVLRTSLTANQIAWITEYLDTGSVSDLDLMVSAMALDFQTNRRNQLHDFLLQTDGDFATGRVRGDINQNGRITLDDVTLLLRRASGYYDLSSGGIEKVEVTTLVGGYKEGTGAVSLSNSGTGSGAEIRPIIRNGVITEFDTVSAGKGLRKAIGLIQVLPESHISNVPDGWRSVAFSQGISYYEIDLTIANGKIQGLSAPGIMYNFPSNPLEAIQPTWEESSITPVINSSNEITGFTVNDGGTGYDSTTASVVIVDVEGEGAVLTANPVSVKDGVIDKINITDGGSNYTDATISVTITGAGGSGATLVPVIVNGVLTALTIQDGGEDYDPSTNGITITDSGTGAGANIGSFEIIDGIVDSISAPSNGGSNYTSNVRAYIERGNSVSATPKIDTIVQDGVITEVIVDKQGINYPSTTTVANTFQRHDPTLKANLNSSGGITSIVSTGDDASKSLCGWQSATITVTDLAAEAETSSGAGDAIGGTGASITVDIDDGKISGFVIGAAGSGYIEPQVTITGTRLNSTIVANTTPDYVEWIDEVIGEPLLGSVYNPLLVDGPGTGGSARVTRVGSNGELQELKLTSFGYNYPDVFTTTIVPEDSSGANAKVTFRSGVVGITSPNYVDRKGFLSDIIKIQDNDLYQEFSYVVETGIDFDIFEDLIKKSVHPAGMKIFGEQSINSQFSIEVQQFNVASTYYNRYFADATDNGEILGGDGTSTRNTDGDIYHMDKDLPRVEDPTSETIDPVSEKETYQIDKDMTSFGNPQYVQIADAEDVKETYQLDKDMTATGNAHYVQIADAEDLKETYSMDKDIPRQEDPESETIDPVSEKETYSMDKDIPRVEDPTSETIDPVSEKETYALSKGLIVDVKNAFALKETYSLSKGLIVDIPDAFDLKETYQFDKDLPRVEDPTSETIDPVSEKETFLLAKLQFDSITQTADGDADDFSLSKPLSDSLIQIRSGDDDDFSLSKPLSDIHYALSLDDKTVEKDLPAADDPTDDTTDTTDSDNYSILKDFPPADDLTDDTVDLSEDDSDTKLFLKGLDDETQNVAGGDESSFLVSKQFFDTSTTSDIFSVADADIYLITKSEADAISANVDEETDKSFAKPFTESINNLLSDRAEMEFSISKGSFTENINVSAEENETVTVLRAKGVDTDFPDAEDAILGKQLSRGLSDSTIGFSTNKNNDLRVDLGVSLSRGLQDTLTDNVSEEIEHIDFSKELFDTNDFARKPITIHAEFANSFRGPNYDNEAVLRLLENPQDSSDADINLDENSELNDTNRDRSQDPRLQEYDYWDSAEFRTSSSSNYTRPFSNPSGNFRGGQGNGLTTDYFGTSGSVVLKYYAEAVLVAYVGDTIKLEYSKTVGVTKHDPANGYWLKTSKTTDTTTDNVSSGVTNQGMVNNGTTNSGYTNPATSSGTLTWDTSGADAGNYYLMGGGLTVDGSTDAQDNSWIQILLLDPYDINEDVDIAKGKALSDTLDIDQDEEEFDFSLSRSISDSASVSDIFSLADADIYSINKGIQDQVSNVANNDSGSVVNTRSCIELGYFATTDLDYEYSSETSGATF